MVKNNLRRSSQADGIVDNSSLIERGLSFAQHNVPFDYQVLREALSTFANPELAIRLSGTNDKKSKPYLAARRALETYRKGSFPRKAAYQQGMIDALLDKNTSGLAGLWNADRSLTVTINGTVQISKLPRDFNNEKFQLPADEATKFINNLLLGNTGDALHQLAQSRLSSVNGGLAAIPDFDIMQFTDKPTTIAFDY